MQQPPQHNAAAGQGRQRWQTFEESDLDDWHKDAETPVRPLTRSEAQALIAKHPRVSVWRVIAMQAAFGVLVALVWGALTNRAEAVLSALYAVGVVVLPSLLMARGVFGPNAGRSVGGLLFWEVAKLGLSGALLALAPVVLKPVDWAALLVTLILCLKVVVVVLLFGLRRSKNSV
ncbi:ATP synthase subunit I [Aquabacterium sp. A3]|uniref:ATP synthase subunit I n=1 Tax=Aquabacterium sp. A3 TaxID=3132829 RepID=UPI00311A8ACA